MPPKKKESSPKKGSVAEIKSKTSIKPALQIDPRDIVLTELLKSLLPCITDKAEVNKSFVKLQFRNANSYYGWIGPNGFQGFGTYKFADGVSFRGRFENSLIRGLGRYKYKKGYLYEGEFLAGRRHGYGQYKSRRFHYDGYFQNGLYHGQGVWKSKSEEQSGTFHEGKITHGEVHDSSGCFKGTFDKSNLRKRGKFTFKNGNTYDGSWLDDLFWGFGVYNWIEEGEPTTKAVTKYVGYWLNGQRYALGMLTFRQRNIICQWDSDEKSGAGVIIACNGNVYASTGMFKGNQYQGATRINLCKESREILLHLLKLTTPLISYETMEEKRNALMETVKKLIDGHAEWLTEVYPIRIPHYEIANLPPEPYNSCFELKFLQQVLTENYKHFMDLYLKYTHSADEYMNNLGLNLFYMDLFHNVRDINVNVTMKEGQKKIRHQCIYSEEEKSCDRPLAAVPFYEFFQHFVRITIILMENEELKLTAERLRPTFFGHLAMQVLYVLRMLQSHEVPEFLVREALRENRPAILTLLQSVHEQLLGKPTIRHAYRYLKRKNVVCGKSVNFIRAVEKYFENAFKDGILCDTEFEISDLELVELVLYTCKLKLKKDEDKQIRELEQRMRRVSIKDP